MSEGTENRQNTPIYTEQPTLPPRDQIQAARLEAPLPDVPGYEVLAELGQGGMGIVYKARQVKADRLVALKMIRAGSHAGADELARFRREAEAVARLQHPNIVQIHEVGEVQGQPFFSLEYVEGGSLDHKLQGNPLPAAQAAELVETLARAIHHAHQHGIIHRDLKPANVLLQIAIPKITDFGLAKRLDLPEGHTQSGAILGTPSYMAPEQAGGRKQDIGPAADIYALGAMLYEMLTGRPPFKGTDLLDTLFQVATEEPVPPSRLQPKLPRDLESVCMKCLEKTIGRRYGTALELAEDLHRFLVGEPVQARPVGRVDRALKWVRRHPTRAAALGLTCLVVVLASIAGTIAWLWQRAEVARELAETAQQKAETAYQGEQKAKKNAENAYQGEQKAKKKAEAAYQGEQQARRQLIRFKYMRDVDLAYREVLDQNWARTRSILGSCPEKLRGWEWEYVDRLCRREPVTIQGHTGKVFMVAFSPDGQRLASSSGDSTVRVWNLAGGKALILRGHTDYVTSVAFSPDGQHLASGSGDQTVRLWNLAGGKPVILRGHMSTVWSVAFSPDGKQLASGSADEMVRVWNLAGGEPVVLPGHTAGISSVAFSPDGKQLASGSHDKTVRLWDLAGGEALTFRGHTHGVEMVAFSPDGKRLASASHDLTVRVWDLVGREALTLRGHEFTVTSVAFSPDGQRLASGASDQTVRVWDLAGGKAVALRGHTDIVMSVAFSPDGRRLASGSDDRTVRVWDLGVEQPVTLRGHTNWIYSVAFSPDGRRLASGSWDQTVRVWNRASGEAVPLLGHTDGVMSVAFSPDGQRLASGSWDKTVRVWNLAGGEPVVLPGHTAEVLSVTFSPDGQRLASTSHDRTVRVWNLAGGKPVTLRGHTATLSNVAFSPDGKHLAGGCADQTVRIWNLAGGKAVTLRGHRAEVRSVAFSPDGQRLASAGDSTVRVWTLAGGKALILRGHTGTVTSVAFSPDGRRLASGSFDQTVRVWDLAGGEALTLRGHTSTVWSVAFSPDGKQVASSSGDQTVRVWETQDTGHWWHLREATARENAKQWFAAAFHLSRCIQQERAHCALEAFGGATSPLAIGAAASLQGLRSLQGRADLASLNQRRWNAFVELRNWTGVETDFARLSRFKPKDAEIWQRQASALLLRSREQELLRQLAAAAAAAVQPFGPLTAAYALLPRRPDRAAFLRVCEAMERQFSDPKDASTIEALVRTRVLVADGLDGKKAARLATLAKKNADAKPASAAYRETYGAALYRAGQYQSAVDHLVAATVLQPGGDSVWQGYFLAMAIHRLGDAARAKEWLAWAGTQNENSGDPGWEKRVAWDHLRREAEAVVNGKRVKPTR